jgi:arylsulfatase
MVDRMDQNIGRLMAHLDERGLTHNTLIIFLSDNGANDLPWDRTPDLEPGPARHHRGYKHWYNLSNTPFKRHKRDANEGGISTPAIARWPAVINRPGDITDAVAHIVDLMPTLLDVAGVDYPESYDGHDVLPMEGLSFKSVLTGKGPARTDEPLYWSHNGSRAVRVGSHKLVATRSGSPWALHDMQTDRVELIDIIEADPKRARTMRKLYDRWADRVSVPE